MRHAILGLAAICILSGCDEKPNSAQTEQMSADAAQRQIIRNQPVPVFDYSLERHMLTEIYTARQRATNTFSVVQSEFSGKVLWSCPSIGYPLPYATQLTNPHQVRFDYASGGMHTNVVEQQEPNGLYSPPQSDATWVPCVGTDGKITPVYEEKHVTVFLQPMVENGGRLEPAAGAKASFSIDPK